MSERDCHTPMGNLIERYGNKAQRYRLLGRGLLAVGIPGLVVSGIFLQNNSNVSPVTGLGAGASLVGTMAGESLREWAYFYRRRHKNLVESTNPASISALYPPDSFLNTENVTVYNNAVNTPHN